MASTITAATMTVTLTEDITLNGSNQGATNTLTIASVNEIYKRIVTCPASQTTTVVVFNSNVYGANGAVDVEDSKYIRITNLDSSNAVEIGLTGAATNYQVTLAAGQSHILGSADDLLLAEEDTSPSFGTMTDLGKVSCKPNGSAVNIEVFIASA